MADVYEVEFTTNGSGDATVFSETVDGPIHAIYIDASNTASSADFTITTVDTGETVLATTNTASAAWFYPRAATQLNLTGTAATSWYDNIIANGERIQIVVAQGGASNTGTMKLVVR